MGGACMDAAIGRTNTLTAGTLRQNFGEAAVGRTEAKQASMGMCVVSSSGF